MADDIIAFRTFHLELCRIDFYEVTGGFRLGEPPARKGQNSPTATLRKDSTLPPVTSKQSIVFLGWWKSPGFSKVSGYTPEENINKLREADILLSLISVTRWVISITFYLLIETLISKRAKKT